MDTETQLHKCDECSREFKNVAALLSHRRTHKKEDVAEMPPNPPLGALDPDLLPSERFLPPDHSGTPRFDTVPANEVLGVPAEVEQFMMSNQAIKKVAAAKQAHNTVRLKKLPHYGELPTIARATEGAAGHDLYAAIERPVCIGVGEREPVPTGLCVEIPSHMYALIAPRSGLACKKGITVVNAPGIIDSDYRGEIVCHLVNHSSTKFWVEPGMRVAQMIFHEYVVPELEVVDELSDTTRGDGGFGSTGS